jgi:hypothetical protein
MYMMNGTLSAEFWTQFIFVRSLKLAASANTSLQKWKKKGKKWQRIGLENCTVVPQDQYVMYQSIELIFSIDL